MSQWHHLTCEILLGFPSGHEANSKWSYTKKNGTVADRYQAPPPLLHPPSLDFKTLLEANWATALLSFEVYTTHYLAPRWVGTDAWLQIICLRLVNRWHYSQAFHWHCHFDYTTTRSSHSYILTIIIVTSFPGFLQPKRKLEEILTAS